MSATPDRTLIDPTPRQLRLALAVGLPSLAVAILVTIGLATDRLPADESGLAALVILALLVFGSAAAVAITICLVLLASARRTAALYARLGRGDALADWRFAPAEWADWLALEERQHGWTWPSFLICVAAVVGITGWAVSSGTDDASSADLGTAALVVGGLVLALGALFGCGRWLARRRTRVMRDRPRVVVLEDAIYCGGVLHRWSGRMTVLRRVTLVPGPPTLLEVTIGQSDRVRAASTIVNVLAAFSGRGGVPVQDTTVRVLVPAGRAEEAAEVVRRLLAP